MQEYIDNISKQEKKVGKADIVPEKQALLKGYPKLIKGTVEPKKGYHELLLTRTKQLEQDRERLLKACQMAHRKHTYGDDSVGWEELSDELSVVLQDIMGDDAYCKWQDEYNDKNE